MFVGQPAQSEIKDLHEPGLRIVDEVLRLDVAMDDALLLGVRQAGRRLADKLTGFAHRQRAAPADHLRKRFAGDEFHGNIGRPPSRRRVQNLGDVRMPQPRGNPGLLQESLPAGRIAGQFRFENLQDQQLRAYNIQGKVNVPHRPGGQQPLDLVPRMLSQFRRQTIEIAFLLNSTVSAERSADMQGSSTNSIARLS